MEIKILSACFKKSSLLQKLLDLCVKSAMCLKENYLVKISYIEAAAIIDVLKHMKEEGKRTSKLILETLCLRLSPLSMASLTSKQSKLEAAEITISWCLRLAKSTAIKIQTTLLIFLYLWLCLASVWI